MALWNVNRERSEQFESTFMDLEVFVQALDPEWTRPRKLNLFDSNFRDRVDINSYRGVPVGNRIAVNVPTRFDIEDDVQPRLLPADVFGRVCGNGDGNSAC